MKIVPNNNEVKFKDNILLVTKTDLKGHITYANRSFMKIVQMDEEMLYGKPHNIIRHPDMPRVIFKLLWQNLQNAKEINAYVKNLCADGSFYWVMANVTPSFDNSFKAKAGTVIGYHSARRAVSQKALQIIQPLYQQLLNAERTGGITASEKILNDLLQEKGLSYDEFILSF
jgi:PAS domain S-box-containing protein